MVITVDVIDDDCFWQMAVIGGRDNGCCGGGDWIGKKMRDVKRLCVCFERCTLCVLRFIYIGIIK